MERRITVLSAGTLCGGASFGHARAYNIVELDVGAKSGRLHLREMKNDDLQNPIWGRRALPSEAQAFLDFIFDAPPEPLTRVSHETDALLSAQDLFDQNDFAAAAALLAPIAVREPLARRLLLECYQQLKETRSIIVHFDPPTGTTETITLMDALWANNDRKRLKALLEESAIVDAKDPSVIEMRAKYTARLK